MKTFLKKLFYLFFFLRNNMCTIFLQKNKIDIKRELQKRCKRWVQEGKVDALQTLAKACERLSPDVFDVNVIYNCIMRTYSKYIY